MNPAYSKYEQIDRYLNKELNPEELNEFLNRLQFDQDLAETVELQQLAHEYILDKEMIELKEKMKSDMDNDSTKNRIRNILFSAGATIVIIAGIYYFWNPITKTSITENKKKLFPAKPFEVPAQFHTTVNPIKISTKENSKVYSKNSYKPSANYSQSITTVEQVSESNGNPFYESAIKESSIIDEIKSSPEILQKQISPCNGISINVFIDVSTSCEGKATGSIKINNNSINGGKEPYLISFNNRNYSTTNEFVHLPAGIYSIKFKDANNCINEIQKEVMDIACKKMTDDAFMPSMGELWKFPVDEHRNATIQIFNEQGVLVFHISTGTINEWDGRDNAGNNLPQGLYHFVLKYENGETEKGRITILK